jgi:cyclophilin family peptidyl-prolyl cis-trans isomerase
MKKIILSAAVAALMTTGASAFDIQTKGEATLYYQTAEAGTGSLFDQDNSKANVGLKIDAAVDMGAGFVGGATLVGLDTAGLEGALVSGTMQTADNDGDATAITQAFVAKTVGKTTVKLGRQELNTPMAFSEGWNVHKNTFNAAVVVNNSLEGVTLVGASVGGSNDHTDLNTFDMGNLGVHTYAAGILAKPAKGTDVNVWYYNAEDAASILWGDASTSVNGVKLSAQAANIDIDGKDIGTQMSGIKASTSVEGINLEVAYNSVDMDDGSLSMANRGTDVKTKLFTQMVANQDAISGKGTIAGQHAGKIDTVKVQLSTKIGDVNVIARQAISSIKAGDFTDTELIAKTKVLGTNVLFAYVNTDDKAKNKDTNIVRVVARYSF